MDLIIRASKDLKVKYYHKALSLWRVHSQSESSNKRQEFLYEKKLMLQDFVKNNNSDENYNKSVKKFKDTCLREEGILEILRGNKKFVYKNILKFQFSIKNLCVIVVSLFPLPNNFLHFLFRIRY